LDGWQNTSSVNRLFLTMPALPLILRSIVCLAYLAIGIFVLIYRPFQTAIFDISFSLACIAYGTFRGYRAFSDYKNESKEE
jgi:hypothetical protein